MISNKITVLHSKEMLRNNIIVVWTKSMYLTIKLTGERSMLLFQTRRFPKVALIEKNENVNNEEKIAETFNAFFTNIVSNLKYLPYQENDVAGRIDPVVGDDPMTFTQEKHKNHPSIIATKDFETLKFEI